MSKEKFKIRSRILNLCLFGGEIGKEDNRIKVSSWSNSNGDLSRILLTHCVQKVFGIYRLPGYEEEYKYYKQSDIRKRKDNYNNVKKLFSSLTQHELEKGYNELEKLYSFIQSKLKESFNNNLVLYRSLAYFEREQILKQIIDKEEKIKFRTNIISSYTTDEPSFVSYFSPIYIKRKIKVEDILIYYKYISCENKSCDYENIEKEVWVINDSKRGALEIPIDNFQWDENQLDLNKSESQRYNIRKDKDYLIRKNSEGIKPCNDELIKILIDLKAKFS
ncbi:hypothetical protein [Orenia marismortui]|uniref:Uncharacterized protein n=1 Tax=Orenia marismortui TaxID=46469 RepID=A0A4R8GFR4_9FIRM|nr:hypothetical protein [Orenia marismortui]TDX43028.1 hypothetical protein C7959_1683 [Orenia marismortui]